MVRVMFRNRVRGRFRVRVWVNVTGRVGLGLKLDEGRS